MDILYLKNSSNACMEILEKVYNAMNTLTLTSYAQQKTNINCMEALQQVYGQLKEINTEASKALEEQELKNKK